MPDDDNRTQVPRIRLSEFRSRAAWNAQRLGDVVRFASGGTPSKTQPSYWNGSIPWISASSMYDTKIADSEHKVTPLAIGNGTRLATKGSLLVLVRGSMLFNRVPMGIADIDVAFNQDVKALAVSDTVNATFLLNQLISLSPHIQINETGIGAGKIETNTLANLTVFFPSPAEQQKIADCLTSLDECITAQALKVEALVVRRNGLTQQLFPRDGETLPRLRLNNFKHDKEWRIEKISNLLKKVTLPISVDPEKTYREIGIRSHGKGIFHKEPVTGMTIGNKRVFHVVMDAFVVNIVFAWEQAVATTSQDEREMIASHRFPMYLARPDKCDVRYIREFFLTKRGKYLLGVASPGGAGRNKTLGQKEFERLEISLPTTVMEQAEIAECLSSAAAQIAVESKKLAALRVHKKGLMQQLFPAPEMS